MSDTTHNFLFTHGGMLRSERLEQIPDPGTMQFSGRTFEQLLARTAEFARSLVFYGDDNRPDGDWTAFFKEVYDYERKEVRSDILEDMVRRADVPPHLALLFGFYRMLMVTQADMNTLTDRQLDFYFQKVLGFRMRKGSEGHATVFAELGKNVEAVSIAKGLLFDAGKDGEGKLVTYEAVDELRLGMEKVAALAYYSVESGFKRNPDVVAGAAGTAPAAGAGATGAADAADDDTPADPSDKTHSLCIAAPILDIPGSDMTISFPDCREKIDEALKKLRAEYTSAEGWTPFNGALAIDRNMPAIACYDPKVHGEGLDTADPVIRLSSDNGYGALSSLVPSELKTVAVRLDYYVPPKLKNKYGEVDNRAEVNPFGPDGKQGDWFEVVLPFEATEPRGKVRINHPSAVKMDTSDRHHIRFQIKDDSCDQAALSKAYADLVIVAFTGNTREKSVAKAAMEKMAVSAVFPRLLSPVQITLAAGTGEVSGVFLQHPCGTDTVTGGPTLTKDASITRQIARLSLAPTLQKNSRPSVKSQTQEKGSALYIGLDRIGTGAGQISLYLDNTGKAEAPGTVQWGYRKGGGWKAFPKSAILKDTTCGLSQSGIVIFDCKSPLPPGDPSFLDGLTCIRALCDNGNGLLVQEVRPRAIEVAYSGSSEGAGPGGAPLPAGTIAKSVHSVVGVKAFSQPCDGDAGARAENTLQFRRRVAERLRHKGRAWSTWDYETLILEAFPDISYVKCLPACQPDGTSVPGHVTIIIIPEVSDDPLKPSPRIRMVNDVKKLLDASKTSFATVDVIGPAYHELTVEAAIALRPGYNDATKYDAVVNDALTDYLRPWVGYRDGRRFKDGDGVSDIIAFLESLPFVDIIEDLKVMVDGEIVKKSEKIERATAVSVLTSAAAHGVKCHTAD